MTVLANLSQLLKNPDFQEEYQVAIREKARQYNSFIAYVDAQERIIREYPASGEMYQVEADGKTLTLLSSHTR